MKTLLFGLALFFLAAHAIGGGPGWRLIAALATVIYAGVLIQQLLKEEETQ